MDDRSLCVCSNWTYSQAFCKLNAIDLRTRNGNVGSGTLTIPSQAQPGYYRIYSYYQQRPDTCANSQGNCVAGTTMNMPANCFVIRTATMFVKVEPVRNFNALDGDSADDSKIYANQTMDTPGMLLPSEFDVVAQEQAWAVGDRMGDGDANFDPANPDATAPITGNGNPTATPAESAPGTSAFADTYVILALAAVSLVAVGLAGLLCVQRRKQANFSLNSGHINLNRIAVNDDMVVKDGRGSIRLSRNPSVDLTGIKV